MDNSDIFFKILLQVWAIWPFGLNNKHLSWEHYGKGRRSKFIGVIVLFYNDLFIGNWFIALLCKYSL
jgi:hypothetical protein